MAPQGPARNPAARAVRGQERRVHEPIVPWVGSLASLVLAGSQIGTSATVLMARVIAGMIQDPIGA